MHAVFVSGSRKICYDSLLCIAMPVVGVARGSSSPEHNVDL